MSEKTRKVREAPPKKMQPPKARRDSIRPFANAHRVRVPLLLNEEQLKANAYTARFMHPDNMETAERIAVSCFSWDSFLKDAGNSKKDEMKDVLEEFITSAFSLIQHSGNMHAAKGMLASLYMLMPHAPRKTFSSMVELCCSREQDAVSARASSLIVQSYKWLLTFPPGEESVYKAVEFFADSLESKGAKGVPTALETSKKFSSFMATASTRILGDSGLLEGGTLLVPEEHTSIIAYGILFGIGFTQEERLSAMDRAQEIFTREGQVALFSRIHAAGILLPTMIEHPKSEGYSLMEIPESGPLLQIWMEELEAREQGPPDERIRKQMISSAAMHLDALGISPALRGKDSPTLQ